MQRALDLAKKATGRTSPNPLVGCVIVRDGKVVGEGYHLKAGTPHAEVHALNEAGELAKGATAYVSLEPCSHYGRTPPCADALIKAQVARVVVAMADPNPLVASQGIMKLREAGIQVDVGLLADEAITLNQAFIKAITTGLPFINYKAALTLDGKIATEQGDSRWISNEASREYVHELRDSYDVIMVGSETVKADNPALTCRIPGGRDPVRLVVDGELAIPESSRVLKSTSNAPCIIATSLAADEDKIARLRLLPGVEIWEYTTKRYVPLTSLMKDLVRRGWNSVLLEGGGGLAGTLIEAGLVDKIEFFIAPKLIGGRGPSPLSGLTINKMSDAIKLQLVEVSLETGDLRVAANINESFLKGVRELVYRNS
ncbi:MAG: bifunctional diaminohydroxyphosphoribosylaminopyrimidine deaminase/5-amino-6-(5-phosphoribosylamino)uracil reductase RibD [Desulfitobacterium hafniense]|nr:bifunctional diaminohydroxyphosphoribosylaminopyrimidine deaminase/5-amino-6-(5-phosphoribosylamino)uracil reductase RibD [Desulfitobacterium hafniense]